jgi:hypothetical protein
MLREQDLMHRERGRTKRYREELEKASRPDEIWGSDLMYLKVGGRLYVARPERKPRPKGRPRDRLAQFEMLAKRCCDRTRNI